MAVATFLEKHKQVTKVFYPGLKSHPQHELAKKQQKGFGGMVSFLIKGGFKEAQLFCQSCVYFSLAESLGGVESLCELPALMTHASVKKEDRETLGIVDNFVRLSCGIEETEDLVNDVQQALLKAVSA